MTLRCEDTRERLLECLGQADAAEDAVRAHLRRCEGCREFARRHARLVHALVSLPRQGVPGELPGRVVAACHEGYLQDRATRVVGRLARYPVPEELDRAVIGPRAPSVLERLVSESLSDPHHGVASRARARLQRRPVPAELERRVARSIAEDAGRRRGKATSGARGRRVAALLAAACLVVVVGLVARERLAPTPAPRYDFVVERVTSARALDPMAQLLVAGLSGGWSEAASPASEPAPRGRDPWMLDGDRFEPEEEGAPR